METNIASDMAYWHRTLDNTKVQKKISDFGKIPLRLVTGSRSATPLGICDRPFGLLWALVKFFVSQFVWSINTTY